MQLCDVWELCGGCVGQAYIGVGAPGATWGLHLKGRRNHRIFYMSMLLFSYL